MKFFGSFVHNAIATAGRLAIGVPKLRKPLKNNRQKPISAFLERGCIEDQPSKVPTGNLHRYLPERGLFVRKSWRDLGVRVTCRLSPLCAGDLSPSNSGEFLIRQFNPVLDLGTRIAKETLMNGYVMEMQLQQIELCNNSVGPRFCETWPLVLPGSEGWAGFGEENCVCTEARHNLGKQSEHAHSLSFDYEEHSFLVVLN